MLGKLSKQLFDDIRDTMSHHEGHLPHAELQALLDAALARLNLVTREQFDAQAAVLMRTREQLEQLEQQLEDLQKKTGIC